MNGSAADHVTPPSAETRTVASFGASGSGTEQLTAVPLTKRAGPPEPRSSIWHTRPRSVGAKLAPSTSTSTGEPSVVSPA